MRRCCAALLALASIPAAAQDLRKKYLALTAGWTAGVIFTPAERAAMERGRRWERLMTEGLDDPLARKAMEGGEPSFESLAALYPGKILDRTVLGSWSDPRRQPGEFDNEFTVWWNGALSANLIKARVNGNLQPQAHNTNLVFRVGAEADMFGRDRNRYVPPGYEDGYLPVIRASYSHTGVEYRLTALADNPPAELPGYDIARVRVEMVNTTGAPRRAELHVDSVLVDGTALRRQSDQVVDAGGRVLFRFSPAAEFDAARGRLTWRIELPPGGRAAVFLKVPYLPDRDGRLAAPGAGDFSAAHRRVREFWNGLLARGTQIRVPEPRVNDIWRALLVQNFILADGARFTYGSGLLYNDSYYPVENGFGAHMFTRLGHEDYGHALLDYCVPVSVDPKLAGRKYQNRRALPFHHLFEDYRLTGRTDTFERFRDDLYRVAEEIITDRRRTMVAPDGRRPLHYGLLPPDRPGVDLRASTQTVYVLAHNITNAQGLQDFGEFLVRTGLDTARGRRYLEEAADFRRAILKAMEGATIRLPGRPPFVDLQTLYFRDTPDFGPDPYDHLGARLQGTYFHYWVEMQLPFHFFNPGEPPGAWLADYVRQRGGFVLGCTRARPRPEQPYGWINNVYNAGYYDYRLRGGDVPEFLLGFYARLAFGMTRHAWVASEGSPFIGYNTENGGFVSAEYSFPNSAANAETLSLLRDMLVFEELRENRETGDLWLLAGTPRAWLENGKRIEVSRAPTYFGEVSFTVESRVAEGLIRATVVPPPARACRAILLTLRHPRSAPLRRALVNGAEQGGGSGGRIRLPAGPREFRIEAYY